MQRSDFEIMAPVGSWESLTAAWQAGADAIYFGIEGLNMRSKSSVNFTIDDLHTIAQWCQERGMKSYLTVNTIVYDEDVAYMRRIIDAAREARVSAIIASDMAAIAYARSIGVEVHISTQVNVSNTEAVRYYASMADVMVMARELSLEQVYHIHEAIVRDGITGPAGRLVRIEMFCHGALCMAVSGKCYLSLHETGASANRGACRQICRRGYIVTDRETGDELAIDNQYIMSPKDLKSASPSGTRSCSGCSTAASGTDTTWARGSASGHRNTAPARRTSRSMPQREYATSADWESPSFSSRPARSTWATRC